ncbi:MAG: helix-turn-helix domain-containing protein [Methylacidiphilales bacterium]|nr:helix-turn-helix domain-containing protein [Candidatus Methylacidiphilales bacterium]
MNKPPIRRIRRSTKPRSKTRALPVHAKRLGHNIARLRELRGWSQEFLAEALGITARYLQKMEAGSNVPSLTMLVKLRGTLRASWQRLFRDL